MNPILVFFCMIFGHKEIKGDLEDHFYPISIEYYKGTHFHFLMCGRCNLVYWVKEKVK
jgi:hypothetical protein